MQFNDETERLVAEQAVPRYRAVQEAEDQPAYGHVMAAIEAHVLAGTRPTGRHWIESGMNDPA